MSEDTISTEGDQRDESDADDNSFELNDLQWKMLQDYIEALPDDVELIENNSKAKYKKTYQMREVIIRYQLMDCVSVALIYCGKGKILVTALYLIEIVIFSGLPSTVIGFCFGWITFVMFCIHCSKMLSPAVGLHNITGILLTVQYLTSLKI